MKSMFRTWFLNLSRLQMTKKLFTNVYVAVLRTRNETLRIAYVNVEMQQKAVFKPGVKPAFFRFSLIKCITVKEVRRMTTDASAAVCCGKHRNLKNP